MPTESPNISAPSRTRIPSWLKAVIGIFSLPTILGILQIFQWFTTPEVDLTATVNSSSWQLPPQYEEILLGLQRFTISVNEGAILPENPTGYIFDLQRNASILAKLSTPLELLERPRLAWTAVVKNNGTKEAHRVRLNLPGSSVAVVEKQGTQPQIVSGLLSVVDLGDLPPQEEVRVTSWATLQAFEEVTLSHSEGRGKVKVMGLASPFYVWISETSPVSLLLSVLVGTLFVVSLVELFATIKSPSQSSNASPASPNPATETKEEPITKRQEQPSDDIN